jgi:hypothetical protein
MGRSCSTNGGGECIKDIGGKGRKGKWLLERPRCRCVDNIIINVREIGRGGTKLIDLAQDRDRWRAPVNTVMNFQVPWNAGHFLSRCTNDGFSRTAQPHEVSYRDVRPMTDLRLRRQRTFGSKNAEVLYRLSNCNILEQDHSPRKYLSEDMFHCNKTNVLYTHRATVRQVIFVQ